MGDRRVFLSFMIDSGLHRRLKIIAVLEDKTMHQIIEEELEIFIRKYESVRDTGTSGVS